MDPIPPNNTASETEIPVFTGPAQAATPAPTQPNPTPPPAPNPAETTPPPPPSKGWIKWLLMGLIIVIVICVGASFFLSQSKTQTAGVTPTKIPTRLSPTVVPAPVDPTATWQPITTNGISFRYPKDWQLFSYDEPEKMPILGAPSLMSLNSPQIKNIKVTNPGSVAMQGSGPGSMSPTQFVSVQLFTSAASASAIADGIEKSSTSTTNPAASQFKREQLTINGNSAEAVFVGGQGDTSWHIFLTNGKIAAEIVLPLKDINGTTTENKILNTFKFADESLDTTNWKTHTFPHFSLSLPNTWTVSQNKSKDELYTFSSDPRGSSELVIEKSPYKTAQEVKATVVGWSTKQPIVRQLTLGAASATEYYDCMGVEGCMNKYTLIINNAGVFYYMSFTPYSSQPSGLYQQILSTLKFTQ